MWKNSTTAQVSSFHVPLVFLWKSSTRSISRNCILIVACIFLIPMIFSRPQGMVFRIKFLEFVWWLELTLNLSISGWCSLISLNMGWNNTSGCSSLPSVFSNAPSHLWLFNPYLILKLKYLAGEMVKNPSLLVGMSLPSVEACGVHSKVLVLLLPETWDENAVIPLHTDHDASPIHISKLMWFWVLLSFLWPCFQVV